MKKSLHIKKIAEETGGQFIENYSGRGMFGETCVGIGTNDPDEVIHLAKSKKIQGEVRDSMGLSVIVYWPSINADM